MLNMLCTLITNQLSPYEISIKLIKRYTYTLHITIVFELFHYYFIQRRTPSYVCTYIHTTCMFVYLCRSSIGTKHSIFFPKDETGESGFAFWAFGCDLWLLRESLLDSILCCKQCREGHAYHLACSRFQPEL